MHTGISLNKGLAVIVASRDRDDGFIIITHRPANSGGDARSRMAIIPYSSRARPLMHA